MFFKLEMQYIFTVDSFIQFLHEFPGFYFYLTAEEKKKTKTKTNFWKFPNTKQNKTSGIKVCCRPEKRKASEKHKNKQKSV